MVVVVVKLPSRQKCQMQRKKRHGHKYDYFFFGHCSMSIKRILGKIANQVNTLLYRESVKFCASTCVESLSIYGKE